MRVLPPQEWHEQADTHYERVHEFANAARKRSACREKHPVFDFLTKYYPFSLGKFEKWQPGYGVTLEEADKERFSEKRYHFDGNDCYLDLRRLTEKEAERFHFTHNLLTLTQARPGVYSCFGLHEWAMVYSGAEVRHRESAPLRMSQAEVDEFVRSRNLVCTHFDAYRFFAPDTQELNKHQPSLDDREKFEQPACIHVNMDLYKWAFKCAPWVGSDFIWDCFRLALQAREVDMKASPYDLSEWGYGSIKIETEQGRSQYVQAQRNLEVKGKALRAQLIKQLSVILKKS